MKLLLMFAMLLTLIACDDSQDIAESLKTQSEVSSQAEIQAANQNLRNRANEMELDLARRHRFYQAVKGRYEGSLQTNFGDFNLRITLTPTIAPLVYSDLRNFRQLEEIIDDLNNLAFNVTVTQWNPATPMSAITCTIERVRADLTLGRITIQSQGCSSQIFLYLSELGTGRATRNQTAQTMASDIRSQALENVDVLSGEVLPNSNAHVFSFEIEKVAQ